MPKAERAQTRVAFVAKNFVWVCVDEDQEKNRPELFVEIELTRQVMRMTKTGKWDSTESATWWARVIGCVGTAYTIADKAYHAACKNSPKDIARVSEKLAKRFVNELMKAETAKGNTRGRRQK